jgi:hypothetical protein
MKMYKIQIGVLKILTLMYLKAHAEQKPKIQNDTYQHRILI